MTTLHISGMSCMHCVQAVTKALEAFSGITNLTVSLEQGTASWEETQPVELDAVRDAIRAIGFDVA